MIVAVLQTYEEGPLPADSVASLCSSLSLNAKWVDGPLAPPLHTPLLHTPLQLLDLSVERAFGYAPHTCCMPCVIRHAG